MTLYKKMVWLFNRLSVMGRQEILYRILGVLVVIRAKLPFKNNAKYNYVSKVDFLNDKAFSKYLGFINTCQWINVEPNKAALLGSEYRALSFAWKFEGRESWFTCPATGFKWSSDFFSNINYRSGGSHGDVRVLWEASRLQQLVVLAHIASSDDSNSEKAIQNYLIQLNSWYQNNPPYQGPHYISVMECALRIISLCFASSLIKEKISDQAYWLKQSNLITSHADIILERLSLHSSSGNHTLTEAVGLIFASKFYSNHPRANKWGDVGSKLFVEEFIRQTNEDGSGIEQTGWYLKFIFELAVITLPLLADKEKDLIQKRVDVVKKFLSKITVNGELLSYGDSDNGYAVSSFIDFISSRETESCSTHHFKDAGLIKISHANSVVFFDYGNLGMPPSYGHGHADCLSIAFYYKNKSILSDRGTYTYNGDERLRRYFRSTSAHNTIVINQQDQSIQSSRFMWKHEVNHKLILLETHDEGTYVLAKHYGYAERFNCIHWRGIFLSKQGELYVWDYIEGEPELIEGYWHFDPNITLNEQRIIHDDFELSVNNLPGSFQWFNNDLETPIGITSDEYGAMLPSFTVKTVLSAREEQVTVFGNSNSASETINNVSSFFQKKMKKGKI